jgi:hypothetical protein
MSNVFDTDLEDVPEDVVDDESTPEETEAAPAAEAAPKKPKRPAPPEGFVTPVGFAHKLEELRADKLNDGKIPPQHVYGWLRTNKTFPNEAHPETGSPIINLEAGLAWFDELQARKSERAAKKAAKAEETTEDSEASE